MTFCPSNRLAKSNRVIFAEAAALMRRHSAPAYIAARFDRLARLAEASPGQATRVLPHLIAGLPKEP